MATTSETNAEHGESRPRQHDELQAALAMQMLSASHVGHINGPGEQTVSEGLEKVTETHADQKPAGSSGPGSGRGEGVPDIGARSRPKTMKRVIHRVVMPLPISETIPPGVNQGPVPIQVMQVMPPMAQATKTDKSSSGRKSGKKGRKNEKNRNLKAKSDLNRALDAVPSSALSVLDDSPSKVEVKKTKKTGRTPTVAEILKVQSKNRASRRKVSNTESEVFPNMEVVNLEKKPRSPRRKSPERMYDYDSKDDQKLPPKKRRMTFQIAKSTPSDTVSEANQSRPSVLVHTSNAKVIPCGLDLLSEVVAKNFSQDEEKKSETESKSPPVKPKLTESKKQPAKPKLTEPKSPPPPARKFPASARPNLPATPYIPPELTPQVTPKMLIRFKNAMKSQHSAAMAAKEAAAKETKKQGQGFKINPRLSLMLLNDFRMALQADEDGDLPIHIAVVHRHLHIVKRLVPPIKLQNRSLDIFNNLRQTPLHLAVIMENKDMVEYLLEVNCNPNVQDRNGQTCIHLSAQRSNYKMILMILQLSKHKVFLNVRNYEGFSPVHIAVQKRSLKTIQCLRDRGADMDYQDGKSGRTPLFHAVESNDYEIAEKLLKCGADPNVANYAGYTAAVSANGRGYRQICVLLGSYGAEVPFKMEQMDQKPPKVTNNSDKASLVTPETLNRLGRYITSKDKISGGVFIQNSMDESEADSAMETQDDSDYHNRKPSPQATESDVKMAVSVPQNVMSGGMVSVNKTDDNTIESHPPSPISIRPLYSHNGGNVMVSSSSAIIPMNIPAIQSSATQAMGLLRSPMATPPVSPFLSMHGPRFPLPFAFPTVAAAMSPATPGTPNIPRFPVEKPKDKESYSSPQKESSDSTVLPSVVDDVSRPLDLTQKSSDNSAKTSDGDLNIPSPKTPTVRIKQEAETEEPGEKPQDVTKPDPQVGTDTLRMRLGAMYQRFPFTHPGIVGLPQVFFPPRPQYFERPPGQMPASPLVPLHRQMMMHMLSQEAAARARLPVPILTSPSMASPSTPTSSDVVASTPPSPGKTTENSDTSSQTQKGGKKKRKSKNKDSPSKGGLKLEIPPTSYMMPFTTFNPMMSPAPMMSPISMATHIRPGMSDASRTQPGHQAASKPEDRVVKTEPLSPTSTNSESKTSPSKILQQLNSPACFASPTTPQMMLPHPGLPMIFTRPGVPSPIFYPRMQHWMGNAPTMPTMIGGRPLLNIRPNLPKPGEGQGQVGNEGQGQQSEQIVPTKKPRKRKSKKKADDTDLESYPVCQTVDMATDTEVIQPKKKRKRKKDVSSEKGKQSESTTSVEFPQPGSETMATNQTLTERLSTPTILNVPKVPLATTPPVAIGNVQNTNNLIPSVISDIHGPMISMAAKDAPVTMVTVPVSNPSLVTSSGKIKNKDKQVETEKTVKPITLEHLEQKPKIEGLKLPDPGSNIEPDSAVLPAESSKSTINTSDVTLDTGRQIHTNLIPSVLPLETEVHETSEKKVEISLSVVRATTDQAPEKTNISKPEELSSQWNKLSFKSGWPSDRSKSVAVEMDTRSKGHRESPEVDSTEVEGSSGILEADSDRNKDSAILSQTSVRDLTSIQQSGKMSALSPLETTQNSKTSTLNSESPSRSNREEQKVETSEQNDLPEHSAKPTERAENQDRGPCSSSLGERPQNDKNILSGQRIESSVVKGTPKDIVVTTQDPKESISLTIEKWLQKSRLETAESREIGSEKDDVKFEKLEMSSVPLAETLGLSPDSQNVSKTMHKTLDNVAEKVKTVEEKRTLKTENVVKAEITDSSVETLKSVDDASVVCKAEDAPSENTQCVKVEVDSEQPGFEVVDCVMRFEGKLVGPHPGEEQSHFKIEANCSERNVTQELKRGQDNLETGCSAIECSKEERAPFQSVDSIPESSMTRFKREKSGSEEIDSGTGLSKSECSKQETRLQRTDSVTECSHSEMEGTDNEERVTTFVVECPVQEFVPFQRANLGTGPRKEFGTENTVLKRSESGRTRLKTQLSVDSSEQIVTQSELRDSASERTKSEIGNRLTECSEFEENERVGSGLGESEKDASAVKETKVSLESEANAWTSKLDSENFDTLRMEESSSKERDKYDKTKEYRNLWNYVKEFKISAKELNQSIVSSKVKSVHSDTENEIPDVSITRVESETEVGQSSVGVMGSVPENSSSLPECELVKTGSNLSGNETGPEVIQGCVATATSTDDVTHSKSGDKKESLAVVKDVTERNEDSKEILPFEIDKERTKDTRALLEQSSSIVTEIHTNELPEQQTQGSEVEPPVLELETVKFTVQEIEATSIPSLVDLQQPPLVARLESPPRLEREPDVCVLETLVGDGKSRTHSEISIDTSPTPNSSSKEVEKPPKLEPECATIETVTMETKPNYSHRESPAPVGDVSDSKCDHVTSSLVSKETTVDIEDNKSCDHTLSPGKEKSPGDETEVPRILDSRSDSGSSFELDMGNVMATLERTEPLVAMATLERTEPLVAEQPLPSLEKVLNFVGIEKPGDWLPQSVLDSQDSLFQQKGAPVLSASKDNIPPVDFSDDSSVELESIIKNDSKNESMKKVLNSQQCANVLPVTMDTEQSWQPESSWQLQTQSVGVRDTSLPTLPSIVEQMNEEPGSGVSPLIPTVVDD